MPTQNQADDFDFVVAAATEQQPQQNVMQQQGAVAWATAAPEQQVSVQNLYADNIPVNSQSQQWYGIADRLAQQVQNEMVQPQPQPVQPQQQPAPVQPDPVQHEVQPEQQESEQEKPDLDAKIESLLEEFWVKDDSSKEDDVNTKLKDVLEKNKKISKLLSDVTIERDNANDELGQTRYEKQQLEITNERLQNRIEQLTEANQALKYDENKMDVNDSIKDFVVFYDKRSKDKDKQTPDSQLTRRTLAEAVKVVEGITNLSMDNYLNEYYNRNNPQMPRIWSNHYWVDQLGFDPLKTAQRNIEAKKNDPNWNPMVDVF